MADRHKSLAGFKLSSGFARQALDTYGTQLLMAVFSLASSVIVARALGPGGRGQYAAAFVWLTPGIVFVGIETVRVRYLNSRGFPISVVVLWAVTVGLNIAGNFRAIPRYGIKGAGAVSSLSYLFMLLGVIWVVQASRKAIPSVEQKAAAVTS